MVINANNPLNPLLLEDMERELDALLQQLEQELSQSFNSINQLHQIQSKFLGKNSWMQEQMRQLSQLSHEDRKLVGGGLNRAKEKFTHLISNAQAQIESQELARKLQQEFIDLDLPLLPTHPVHQMHKISITSKELCAILGNMGFAYACNDDITSDWENFTALNVDEYHPARQDHDSFYLDCFARDSSEPLEVGGGEVTRNKIKEGAVKWLLRTHTSNTQVKMFEALRESGVSDLKFISYGRTYRKDSDRTHTPMFHQMEGAWVSHCKSDVAVSIHTMHSTISAFIKNFFENEELEVRFRASYFPFTEPSFEVDIKQNGSWLEVMGCGMVHPSVLSFCKLNPEEYRGFAFGLGIERFAMIKYNLNDLRTFFDYQHLL
ncbi:Phenylalanine--tRNA ligase alpha subunit [Rickettsiales endosymbiont of Paramecium tredecaurelia]|uniref:phenylalanine--tRNA ligase subunit alpha n=1 Tax=Candidatus Sarmatiella mevalonica TaxID=2770581 RepID=UPI0019243F66|nr:phenylalanine--tRNA ligase subunit alpha [Candidatus Sarmatiella mevalonica]MBL3284300.1 Phenylalanine--tRNA ligase alpha subunit [Candidatus Sarmatiella mevalonica]